MENNYNLKILKKIKKKKLSIAIVGLGYVGLKLLLQFANKKFKVYGFDNNLKKIKNLKNNKVFDYIVISSFEYQTTISEKIKKLFNSKKIFEIYDNSSRSLMDTYLIKNIKTNKKLFIQGSKTPVI